jgi:hypothetical protein
MTEIKWVDGDLHIKRDLLASFMALLILEEEVMPVRVDAQPEKWVDAGMTNLQVAVPGPWIEVDFENGHKYAILKYTGDVYRCKDTGLPLPYSTEIDDDLGIVIEGGVHSTAAESTTES